MLEVDICLIYTSKLTSESNPIEQLLSSVEKEQAQNNYCSNSLRFETD
jgi:transposase